eukprot:6406479-Lingulodinium_polyedra.AAC.1
MQVQAQTSSWVTGDNHALFQGQSGKGLFLTRDVFDPEWSRSGTLYRPWLKEPPDSEESLEKLFDRRH